jgi:hypothetical protein
MTRRRPIVPLPDNLDEGPALPPPRKPSNGAQHLAPGYVWNGGTQELIPILPEDHPDYAANVETVTAAIRRWNRGENKPGVIRK